MLNSDQLAALGAVLRLGSFGAAARALYVTPSAISQRIKALEETVGASLVHRGQPCTGTAAGLRLAKHAEDIALLESLVAKSLALEEVGHGARVKIAVNADSLATWFIEAMAACPDLLFDLQLDDQDHSAGWLRRGEVSAAVTAHDEAPAPGCQLIPLGCLTYVATASPAFIARWCPEGVTAEALAQAPCLTYDAKDALQRRWLAEWFGAALDPPSHYIPSTQAFLDATRAGLGWCLNPLPLAAPLLHTGDVERLVEGTDLDVPLCWQVSRVMAPALEEMTAAVQAAARRHLSPPPP